MPNKTTFYATIASVLLAASCGYAQDGDSVTIGFTTVAQTLEDGGNRLMGTVAAACKGGQGLGGARGTITESTTKGTPGGGPCNSDFIVTGSASGRDIPETPCESKLVSRPAGGWKGLIHHAYFASVIVTGGKLVCSMGGN